MTREVKSVTSGRQKTERSGIAGAWAIFDYERSMGTGIQLFLRPDMHPMLPEPLRNAAVESLILHTRSLVDILVSKNRQEGELTLNHLLPDFESPHLHQLRQVYGDVSTPGSPCRKFNDLLMHASRPGMLLEDYLPALKAVWGHIEALVKEIDAVRPR